MHPSHFVKEDESMSDATTTVAELRAAMRKFVSEREWEQFHSPKNLAMSTAIEAAELMEHFQWMEVAASRDVVKEPRKLQAIGEELADVLSYSLALANALDLDISEILADKMRKNALKYPADQFKGRSGRD
jgi:NTP pyrophosphatase (non-canonical NTP hydrolase)